MNLFQHILYVGTDEGFESQPGPRTATVPGTAARVAVMARRVELGFDIFNPHDADADGHLLDPKANRHAGRTRI